MVVHFDAAAVAVHVVPIFVPLVRLCVIAVLLGLEVIFGALKLRRVAVVKGL
jgi:hypothetical protein